METGNVPQQIVESVAGHPPGGVHVNAVKGLHDLGVVGDIKVRGDRLTKPLHLYVGAVVGTDGHGGIDDVGDLEQDAADLLGQLGLLGLQLRQTVGVGLYLGLGFLRLCQLGGVFFCLAHQHTHLLGEGVAGRPQVVGLAHGRAVFPVQGNDLVHQGKLGALELLLDVFLDHFRVFSNKANVQHRNNLFSMVCGVQLTPRPAAWQCADRRPEGRRSLAPRRSFRC